MSRPCWKTCRFITHTGATALRTQVNPEQLPKLECLVAIERDQEIVERDPFWPDVLDGTGVFAKSSMLS